MKGDIEMNKTNRTDHNLLMLIKAQSAARISLEKMIQAGAPISVINEIKTELKFIKKAIMENKDYLWVTKKIGTKR